MSEQSAMLVAAAERERDAALLAVLRLHDAAMRVSDDAGRPLAERDAAKAAAFAAYSERHAAVTLAFQTKVRGLNIPPREPPTSQHSAWGEGTCWVCGVPLCGVGRMCPWSRDDAHRLAFTTRVVVWPKA